MNLRETTENQLRATLPALTGHTIEWFEPADDDTTIGYLEWDITTTDEHRHFDDRHGMSLTESTRQIVDNCDLTCADDLDSALSCAADDIYYADDINHLTLRISEQLAADYLDYVDYLAGKTAA